MSSAAVSPPIERINVLGVGLSVLNMETALRAIKAALQERRKGYLCFTGVHPVMEAQADESLRTIFNHAFLATPDGMPMVWLGRFHGHPEMGRVYGPDLLLEMMEWSRTSGCRHFFYGGSEGVADALAEKMRARFPGVEICGTFCPPFRALNETERTGLIATIDQLRPDVIWVGLGSPKQDRFMAEYLPLLNTTLMAGVGAAFDFHTGRITQAPRWMQRSGLEWLFRVVQEPRRLGKRYLKSNPLFVLQLLLQLSGLRKYPLAEREKR
jgi:N-acetylglucosaminyldiphosphoundecaprenol N-acetyl-beta-D-mannosaminyltransferase